MATRSTISIHKLDGTVKQIYCHWDGYPEHNGRILKTNYATPNRVRELIALGDLSVLAEEPSAGDLEHSFNNPVKGICVAYGRDRGEEDTEATVFQDIVEFSHNYRVEDYDYIYLEERQKWMLIDYSVNKSTWRYKEFLPELDKEVQDTVEQPMNIYVEQFLDKQRLYAQNCHEQGLTISPYEFVTALEELLKLTQGKV